MHVPPRTGGEPRLGNLEVENKSKAKAFNSGDCAEIWDFLGNAHTILVSQIYQDDILDRHHDVRV